MSYLTRPFNSDGAMFIYMGKLVTEGGRFGHDLVDNKFPTVGLLTSFAFRLFGNTWWPYVWLQFSMTVLMSLMLARTGRRHFSAEAETPVLLFSLVFLNLNTAVFGGFQLETIQSFFTVFAACAAIEAISGGDKRDSFLTGLCAGCAMLVKPTGLAVLVAFAAAMCCRHRARAILAHAGAAVIGLCIPAGVSIAYMVQTDILADLPQIWRQISLYAQNSAINSVDLLKPLIAVIVLGLPTVVRGWVFRRQSVPANLENQKPYWIFALGWFAIELFGVIAQRRMYSYHFFVLIPPAVLVYGLFPRKLNLASLAGGLIPAILLSVAGAAEVLQYSLFKPQVSQLGQYLGSHAKAGELVWADDMPRLLLETNLKPASRYPLTFLFLNHDNAAREICDVILWDFQRNKPTYLVLPTGLGGWLKEQTDYCSELARLPIRRAEYHKAWRRIEAYTLENYRYMGTTGDQAIYRRKD